MTRDKDPVREGDSSSSSSPVDASSSGSWSMEEGVRRVGRTTGIAATSGALLGAILAVRSPTRGLRQLVASSATSAVSLGMLGLSYSSAKEYSWTLIGSESPINSAVGGAAAGGLLFASHGGNPILGAAIVSAFATLADAVLISGLHRLVTRSDSDANDASSTIDTSATSGRSTMGAQMFEGGVGMPGDTSPKMELGASDGASWWSLGRWVRKTSEEERLAFLEKVCCT